MAIDEVDGLAGQGIREVGIFHDRLASASDGVVSVVVGFVASHMIGVMEPLFANPTTFRTAGKLLTSQHRGDAVIGRRNEIMAFVRETEELVETVAKRMIVGRATLVPFADYAGRVTGVM